MRSLTATPMRLEPRSSAERPHVRLLRRRRHAPTRRRAAMRSASSMPAGSLPPAVAMSPLPPPPPPTALAASLISAAAGDAASRAATAATSDTPPASVTPSEHDDVDAGWLAHGERQVAQVVGRQAVDALRRPRRRPPPRRARRPARWPAAAAAPCSSSSSARDLVELALHAAEQVVAGRADERGDASASTRSSRCSSAHAVLAGDRLDAAQVGADRALADDLDRADVAGGAARACRRTARSSGPASSTRTMSPYLSPKKAIAPIASASSLVVSKTPRPACWRASRCWRCASISVDLVVGERARSGEKSKRSRSGADERAGLLDVLAEHLRAARSAAGGCRCGCGGWRRAARRRSPPSPSAPGAIAARRRRARRDGAGRAGRTSCRAPRRRRSRCVIVPVSPTWPPRSA